MAEKEKSAARRKSELEDFEKMLNEKFEKLSINLIQSLPQASQGNDGRPTTSGSRQQRNNERRRGNGGAQERRGDRNDYRNDYRNDDRSRNLGPG